MNAGGPRVCILILNRNGWGDTIECLESVLRISYPNYAVAVVDNCSTDGSAGNIRAWAEGRLDVWRSPGPLRRLYFPPVQKPVLTEERFLDPTGGGFCLPAAGWFFEKGPGLILLRNGKNSGFAGGNNLGFRFLMGTEGCPSFDYLMLLNNDTVVDRDFLSNMVAYAQGAPSAGVVGCKIFHYDRPDVLQCVGNEVNMRTGASRCVGEGLPDDGRYDRARDFSYISGACMLIKPEVLEKVGALDEGFFMYLEDVDFCLRARRAGFACTFFPHARIWHKWEQSSNPMFVRFMLSRNRIRLVKKHEGMKGLIRHMAAFIFVSGPRQVFHFVRTGRARLVKPMLLGAFHGLLGTDKVLYLKGPGRKKARRNAQGTWAALQAVKRKSKKQERARNGSVILTVDWEKDSLGWKSPDTEVDYGGVMAATDALANIVSGLGLKCTWFIEAHRDYAEFDLAALFPDLVGKIAMSLSNELGVHIHWAKRSGAGWTYPVGDSGWVEGLVRHGKKRIGAFGAGAAPLRGGAFLHVPALARILRQERMEIDSSTFRGKSFFWPSGRRDALRLRLSYLGKSPGPYVCGEGLSAARDGRAAEGQVTEFPVSYNIFNLFSHPMLMRKFLGEVSDGKAADRGGIHTLYFHIYQLTGPDAPPNEKARPDEEALRQLGDFLGFLKKECKVRFLTMGEALAEFRQGRWAPCR